MTPDEWFSCYKKVRYGHLSTAEKAVESMNNKSAKPLEAYKCRYCDGFHIGRIRRIELLIQYRLPFEE